MVDALREVWRVLRPDGCLIDLRPLARDTPIELVEAGGAVEVGQLDGSRGISDDLACDEALARVVEDGAFRYDGVRRFEFGIYFDTLDEMRDHVERSRARRCRLPSATALAEVGRQLAEGGRLRLREHVILARYRKQLGPAP